MHKLHSAVLRQNGSKDQVKLQEVRTDKQYVKYGRHELEFCSTEHDISRNLIWCQQVSVEEEED